MPLLSVVIPTFNRGVFIERAIRSATDQSYSDIEVIIVDDGSIDDTSKRIRSLQDNDARIHYLRHETTRGAQAARNKGIAAASGEFIAFLDSDDQWLPHKLNVQMQLFDKIGTKCGVVYGGFRYVYDDNRPQRIRIPKFSGNIYKDSLREWIADTNTIVARKSVIMQAGGCDERVRAYQEWDLCIRLSRHAEFYYVPGPVAIYNVHAGPTISKDLLRNANGYLDILSIHHEEILNVLGKKGLALHLVTAAKLFTRASDFDTARQLLIQGLRMRPFSCRALMYWFLCRFSPEMLMNMDAAKMALGRLLRLH